MISLKFVVNNSSLCIREGKADLDLPAENWKINGENYKTRENKY